MIADSEPSRTVVAMTNSPLHHALTTSPSDPAHGLAAPLTAYARELSRLRALSDEALDLDLQGVEITLKVRVVPTVQ